jgi:hypothetical protein
VAVAATRIANESRPSATIASITLRVGFILPFTVSELR